ncbi:hypothetical protein RQP46_009093 [Phenoliferia psychrophenolica]
MSRRVSVTHTFTDAEPTAEQSVATATGTAARPSHQAVFFSPSSTIRPTFDIKPERGLYSSKRATAARLPSFLRSPRVALNALVGLNACLLLYLILRPAPKPTPLLPSRFTEDLLNLTYAATAPNLHAAPREGFESCETCVLSNYTEEPLCEYGLDNVKLSRMYEGSGFRVRRFLEKAMRGDAVSIAVLKGTEARGGEPGTLWHSRFLEDFVKSFPKTKLFVGTSPGGDSEYLSMCFNALVPDTADLYILANEPLETTHRHEDSLYRGIMGLPQQPALIRLSGTLVSEMAKGPSSTLQLSEFFDVPVIGIRNLLFPHIIAHPSDRDLFLTRTRGEADSYTPTEEVVKLHPSCELVSSTLRPLIPLEHSSVSFVSREWIENGSKMAALASSVVGATISFAFRGSSVGIFLYSTHGKTETHSPGQAICSVDGLTGDIFDAGVPEDYNKSHFKMVVEGLKPGEHVLSCEILPHSSAGQGHDIRIMGIGSQ